MIVENSTKIFHHSRKKRLTFILKWAESQDGYIDKDFQTYENFLMNYQVSFVHQIRSEEHAILVGT